MNNEDKACSGLVKWCQCATVVAGKVGFDAGYVLPKELFNLGLVVIIFEKVILVSS